MGERRTSPISSLHHPTNEMARQCGGFGLLIIERREPPATAAPDAEYAL